MWIILALIDGNKGEKMLEENKILDNTLIFMKSLNLWIVTFLSMLMFHSINGYINDGQARQLITVLDVLPIKKELIPLAAIGLYVCLLLLMSKKEQGNLGWRITFEVLLAFVISHVLGFGYTGVFLLILTDAMQFFPQSKWKIPIAIGICLLYLVVDENPISSIVKLIPLTVYLQYYMSDIRFVLSTLISFAEGLNMLLLLVNMIMMVKIQVSEKEKVLQLNDQLNQANAKLNSLNLQLEEYARESEKMAQTRERNRLAREIHDTLGHSLTGIITALEACIAIFDGNPEIVKKQLGVILNVARQGMTDVRRSVKALRPDALEKMNLNDAIKQMIEETKSTTNAEIIYSCYANLVGFSEDEEEVIYRIIQESITNAIRHGHANEIKVTIHREYNVLKISVIDNGIGCEEIKKGFGLHHMEERVRLLQGSLQYKSDHGFRVNAVIPIRWGQEVKK